MPLYRLADHAPQIAGTSFVATEATVIDRATLAEHVSIWPGAVVRADNEPITIGAGLTHRQSADVPRSLVLMDLVSRIYWLDTVQTCAIGIMRAALRYTGHCEFSKWIQPSFRCFSLLVSRWTIKRRS